MKINGINDIMNSSFSFNVKQSEYKVGDLIKGKVSKVSDNTLSIDLGDTFGKIDVNKNSNNENMKVGDELLFEIKSIDNDKISMSEVCKETACELDLNTASLSSKDVYNNMDVMKKIAERNEEATSKENGETEPSNDILGRLNNNAVEEKIEQILNHEDILVNDLSVEKFMNVIVSSVETNENFSYDDSMTTSDILKALNLPETEENINYIDSILAKLRVVDELDSNAIINMIKNDMPVTLNNIYKAVYNYRNVNSYNANNQDKLDGIEDIDHEIEKILNAQNIEQNDEVKTAAKKLIENDIDITEDNIKKLLELEKVSKNIIIDEVLKNAAKNISYGYTQDLYVGSNENIAFEVEQIQKSLDVVASDINILKNVSSTAQINNSLTIDQIRKYIESNLNNNMNRTNNVQNVENLSEQELEVKENINMIRLTLTVSAMNKMYDMGVDINLSTLKEAANTLRNIASNEVEVDNTKLFVKTYDEINILKVRDFRIYTNIEETTSLDYLSKRNVDVTNAYESNMTKSNYTLGSEIKIAERNVDEVLKMNNIELTDVNRKSALALSLNNIDITLENVSKIADLEQKLSYVIDKLKPEITLNMIEEGYDPTLMNIDDLVMYIDKYNEENKVSNTKKDLYTELTELLNSNNIDDTKKEALIGIYRVLNKVTSTKEVGTANLTKYDDVNLTDIYNATKQLEKRNSNSVLDVNIDDNFGLLESVVKGDNNALNMIRKSIDILRSNTDNQFNAQRVIDNIKYVTEKQEMIEDIYEKINDTKMSEIESFISFEQGKREMKDAIKTIDQLSDSDEVKTSIKKLNDDINEKSYELIDEDIDKYKDNIKQMLMGIINDDKMEKGNDLSVNAIKSITNMIDFTDKNQNAIQIPVYMNDELINVNVYFKDDNKASNISKIDMSADLENIGEITCSIEINDAKKIVNINIDVNAEDAVTIVRDSGKEIEDLFKELGYDNASIKVNGYKLNADKKNIGNKKIINLETKSNKFEEII